MVLATLVERYRRKLISLPPPGLAWTRAPQSVLVRLLEGLAVELARVELRGEHLRRDADPRVTIELLPEWEALLGLPDPCAPPPTTLEERRAAVVARLQEIGGQSPGFFIGLAETLGYTIEIEEHRPFQVGRSAVGEPLNSEEWRFVWTVHAPEESIQEFRVGLSAVGEPLRSWGNEVLECAFQRLAPAHTVVRFAYDLDDAGPQLLVRLLDGDGNEVVAYLTEGARLAIENEFGQVEFVETDGGVLEVRDKNGDLVTVALETEDEE